MIQKLQRNEYLRRFDNMPIVEQQELMSRIGLWLTTQTAHLLPLMENQASRLNNSITCSTTWNDAACAAWSEGVRLLTPFAYEDDSWLPDMLYVKAARRCIRWMLKKLQSVHALYAPQTDTTATPLEQTLSTQEQPQPEKRHRGRPRKNESTTSPLPATVPVASASGPLSAAGAPLLHPTRPKHIDQYVHLLPEKTQKRAAQVKDLLAQLDTAREKARLLMDGNDATARAGWMAAATRIDNTLHSIYKELDTEWEKLVKAGRVTVDDLGNAHVIPSATTSATEPTVATNTPSDPARRRTLRKWLGDTRRGNGATREEHIKKWRENFREYLALEGDTAFSDEKLMSAAKHYGIKPKDLKDEK